VDLAAPLLIFGVFTYDMIYITADRVASGRVRSLRQWIEYVGRDHLHHRLAEVLGRPEHAVLFIYAMSCALGLGATLLLRTASSLSAVLLLVQAVVILLMVTILERRGRRHG